MIETMIVMRVFSEMSMAAEIVSSLKKLATILPSSLRVPVAVLKRK